jgi:23S rRNA (adenine2030-N6)-methyltransferase
LTVFDTHAGAGLYDLHGEAALRSGEAAGGVMRLLADPDPPPVFDALIAAVRREHREGVLRQYPGSPLLAVGALRAGDRYVGCELRPDDHSALADLLRKRKGEGVEALATLGDGYTRLGEGAAGGGRRLVLIDPPFERGDEYLRVIDAVRQEASRPGVATFLVWTPLKDLQTFDAFLGGLEAIGSRSGVAVEARLRPLSDPLRLNGCAMVVLGQPPLINAVAPLAMEAARWIAEHLGDDGAQARLEALT